MEESQVNIDYDFSQEDMYRRPTKKARRGSFPKKNSKVITKVPAAIRTRGTPAGYYEIPVRQLIKLYTNTSTGFWETTQGSGTAVGTRGWRGMGLSFQLDNTNVYLGEGSTSSFAANSVPGFTELQAVFDLCKIVDIEVEFWWTNQTNEISSATSYGAFDLYVAEDPNNIDCPTNIGTIMQYQTVKRYTCTPDSRMRYKIKPHIRMSGGSDDLDAGTSTTLGVTYPSTYIQTNKPAVSHLGFRAWVDIPTSATARVGTLNMMITQTRRYKMSR